MIKSLIKCFKGELPILYTLAFWLCFGFLTITVRSAAEYVAMNGDVPPSTAPEKTNLAILAIITFPFFFPFLRKVMNKELKTTSRIISAILAFLTLSISIGQIHNYIYYEDYVKTTLEGRK